MWVWRTNRDAAMASQSVVVRKANAAYNLSASKFVKQYLAIHDRGIKNALKQMAAEVHGKAIDRLTASTEAEWDLERKFEFANAEGVVILRPVALKKGNDPPLWPKKRDDISDIYQMDGRLYTLKVWNKTGEGPTYGDGGKARSHSNTNISGDADSKTFSVPLFGGSTSATYETVYAAVRGNLHTVEDAQVRLPLEQSASDLWERITHDEWSIDLPERKTLQIKGYVAHARAATTFAAMRLDLINSHIYQDLVRVGEEADVAGATDFDKEPFPFEERMREDDALGIQRKLDYLAKWITICIFDRPDVKSVQCVASEEFWSRMHRSIGNDTLLSPFEDSLADTSFKTLSDLTSQDASAKTFHDAWETKVRSFERPFKLYNRHDQIPIETYPYVLPFVDMSQGFVWGSTVTPFMLALIGAASCVSLMSDNVQLEAVKGAQSAGQYSTSGARRGGAAPIATAGKIGPAGREAQAQNARDLRASQRENIKNEKENSDLRLENRKLKARIRQLENTTAGGGLAATPRTEEAELTLAPKGESPDSDGALAAGEDTALTRAFEEEPPALEEPPAENEDKNPSNYKDFKPKNEDLVAAHKWFWDNFLGIHYSNRKSLNNGVYAVLFRGSKFFSDRFQYNANDDGTCKEPNTGKASDAKKGGDATAKDGGGKASADPADDKVPIFVKVHGRYPVSLDSKSMLGNLYSMLEEVRMQLVRLVARPDPLADDGAGL